MNAAGNPHAAAALAHHNFFFPGNQREHFRSVFRQREIPHDPTIYLVAASRTDPTVAPPGCEGLKILPHCRRSTSGGPSRTRRTWQLPNPLAPDGLDH